MNAAVLLLLASCLVAVASSECANGGLRLNDGCVCKENWTGSTCEVPKSCANGRLTNDGTRCECDVGFITARCEIQLCINGAVNQAGDGCECNSGYEGFQCNVLNDCSGHGLYNQTGEKCDCFEGYMGSKCDECDIDFFESGNDCLRAEDAEAARNAAEKSLPVWLMVVIVGVCVIAAVMFALFVSFLIKKRAQSPTIAGSKDTASNNVTTTAAKLTKHENGDVEASLPLKSESAEDSEM